MQRKSTETGTVATGTTQFPVNNSTPQNTAGDQYMSLSFTPLSSANILMIQITTVLSSTVGGTNGRISVGLFQDSNANALASALSGPNANQVAQTTCFTHIMTAGTTSATTFKIRAGTADPGTTTFNGENGAQYYNGTLASSIIITEWTS